MGQAGYMSDIRAGAIELWGNVQQIPIGTGTATADTARLARPPGAWTHSGLRTPGFSFGQQGFSGSFEDTDRLPLPPCRLVSATIGRDMSNDLVS